LNYTAEDLVPTAKQSYRHDKAGKGTNTISKLGNPHLRRFIWPISTHVIEHYGTFRAYYEKKTVQGGR
jgi:transposase